MKSRSVSAGWATVISATAVVSVNAAGIWGIAVARRGVREEAARLFRAHTDSRARTIESQLSATRTDLAFLAGSSAVSRLGGGGAPVRADGREWGRLATEAGLLVFLRGHPEVKHMAVMAGKADALVEAGRRGGVPVLWRNAEGTPHPVAEPGPAEASGERPIRAVFAYDVPDGTVSARLVAEIDARALLDHGNEPPEGLSCALRDGVGHSLLAGRFVGAGAATPNPGEWLAAEATLRAEGWSAPSPWSLSCAQPGGLDASLEPLAARGRIALWLNLVGMGLTVVLGFFAVRQARRQERLEAEAREEQHVRELERQLFHAERLGTVGRLAAGLAHELNNPLEGMANYMALAREHLTTGDLSAARGDLDLVGQGLDRAAGIVRQVLAQANRADAPQGPAELGEVLRQTVDFIRSRPEFRSISFQVELPDDRLMVNGGPIMLGQIFLNLLRNACEAQPHGGEVGVTAGRLGGEIHVEIADRGPGVPAADRRRIFEPFYSTKSSTGLGLSVIDAIVREQQGRVEVRDRTGGGTVFALSLPALAPGEVRPA